VLNSATGTPEVFTGQREAEAEARRVLFNMLNSGPPRETATKDKLAAYEKLTGPEFAVLLSEIDVSPTWFAFIMATNYPRVMDWISGAQDVPHTARVLLEIFKRHPEAIDTAEEATRAVASERVRRPSRREQPD
jgi:DNA-binding transcriptional regulator YiaG